MAMLMAALALLGTVPVYAGAGIDAYHHGDWDRAWHALEPQAQKGDPFAAFYIAKMYEGGLGRQKDVARAVYWYTQSAAKGNADARAALVALRGNPPPAIVVPPRTASGACDIAKITALGTRAAAGNNDSATDLGLIYESDACGEPNYAAAARYYEMAARKGQPQAANNLGVLYYEGKGVTQDFGTAQRLYGQAAEAGYPVAQYRARLGSLASAA
jgi:TPR repeat protein